MAGIQSNKLYHLERSKIGFDGNKRNVYEHWQFVTSFVDGDNIFLIDSGYKYVHEDACHSRRKNKLETVRGLEGKYYKRPAQHISLMDWQCITKCIKEKLKTITYDWYGATSTMTLKRKNKDGYMVNIDTGKYLYRFKIRVVAL